MLRSRLAALLLLGSAFALASCDASKKGSASTLTGGSSGSSGSSGSAGSAASSGAAGSSGSSGQGGTSATGGTGGAAGTAGAAGTQMVCGELGDACTKCLSNKCNMLYCNCYADPGCGKLVECSQGCNPNDMACVQSCFTQQPNSISTAALVSDCGAAQCPECPGTGVLEPCQKCLFTSCPSQMNKCLANAECNKLVQCVGGCNGDIFCQGDCYNAYPGGQNDADDVSGCLENNCSGQCE
jgi:hypothetical protein